ncbi:metal-dependent hydrolase [Marinospirillum sp.]|uniref:metal-dependent hydrolase n=1 Tax=Marinospirillum sp. TaxID=2183934 RepID=UPI00384FBE19
MANFATHTGVAAAIGSSLSTALLVTAQLDAISSLFLLFFFIAGTLLPDIDVDKARPVRWLFNIFALMAALMAVVLTHPQDPGSFWSFSEPQQPGWRVALIALVAWVFTRYPLAWFFQRFTRHRGLCHSLLIASIWALGWIHLGLSFMAVDDLIIWLQGLAIFLGFILHLLLDELYSVDFEGARLKRSFGSALKIYQKDFISGSLLALAALTALVWLLPWPESLLNWMQPWFN